MIVNSAYFKFSLFVDNNFISLLQSQKHLSYNFLYYLDLYLNFSSSQIMPRAQNAHAIVNAGFLMNFNSNTITECRIVYGGINPNFIRARATEAVLNRQKLFDNNTLKGAYDSLDKEVICDYHPPDPTPEYRKNLAISLFYKVSTISKNEMGVHRFSNWYSILHGNISQLFFIDFISVYV